jgi:hypothetical protein
LHQRLLIAAATAIAVTTGGGAAALHAQPVHAGGAAAATRSVSRYLALERELQQALAARDDAAVNARVDADFEYRSPASPDVKDRAEWLRSVPHAPTRVRDLTANEQGEITIVSFLADAQGRTRFIVDVWKGDTLLSRSSAFAPEAPKAPKRPGGRE